VGPGVDGVELEAVDEVHGGADREPVVAGHLQTLSAEEADLIAAALEKVTGSTCDSTPEAMAASSS